MILHLYYFESLQFTILQNVDATTILEIEQEVGVYYNWGFRKHSWIFMKFQVSE